MDMAQGFINAFDTEQQNNERLSQNRAIMDMVNNFVTASNYQDQQGPPTDDQGNALPSNPYADRQRQENMAKIYALTDNPDQATAMPQGQLGPMVTALMAGASPEANAAKQWDMMNRQKELQTQGNIAKQTRLEQALQAKADRQEAEILAKNKIGQLQSDLEAGRITQEQYTAGVNHLMGIPYNAPGAVGEAQAFLQLPQEIQAKVLEFLRSKSGAIQQGRQDFKIINPPALHAPTMQNDEQGQYYMAPDGQGGWKAVRPEGVGMKTGAAKSGGGNDQAILNQILGGNQPQSSGGIGGFLKGLFSGGTPGEAPTYDNAAGGSDADISKPFQAPNPQATAPAAPVQIAPQGSRTGFLPPQAEATLKEGTVTNFKNGQSWTKKNGKAVRVK